MTRPAEHAAHSITVTDESGNLSGWLIADSDGGWWALALNSGADWLAAVEHVDTIGEGRAWVRGESLLAEGGAA